MTQKTDKAARISLPAPENMSVDQKAVYDDIVGGKRGTIVGPLRAALHSPHLASAWQKFGAALRYDTVFDPKYSELAILLTARRWNCELEWAIHRKAARVAGLEDAICDAIRDHKTPVIDDPKAQIVYDFVAQMQNNGQVEKATHAGIVAHWGEVGVVELTALIGYYVLVAMTLNAHQIPLPPNAQAELYPDDATPPDVLSKIPARAGG